MSGDDKRILYVLQEENRWLTFDELYGRVPCDCDWTDFALRLEQLVQRGSVEYTLPYGMDVGCYRIKKQCSQGHL